MAGNNVDTLNDILTAVSDEEDITFRNESKKETDKAEGFADDTTGLTLFEFESLSAIKKILIDFGNFSGLRCNVDKTVLMQIGEIRLPSQEILDLGFTLVDKIKILGMEIDHSLTNLNGNFVGIHDSIKKTIGYWKRYNLTLPGRINVAKSLLVSLINYLGCFIMPEANTLNGIQKSIDDFVIDKLKVARNRLYLPVDVGGLGCFKLDEFLTAQQCVWVIRAARSCRDNWRVNLRIYSYGNALSFSWRNVDPNSNPVLFGLGKAWEKLRVNHDSTNENYRFATVLFNPMIFQGPGNKNTLTPAVLEAESDFSLCKKLSVLTVDECYGQYGFLTRAEFRIQLGIDLSLTGYANLGRAVNHFVNRLTVNRLNDGSATTLFSNIQLKKPGEKIRNMLVKRRKKPFDISTMPTVRTFFEITGVNYVGNEMFSKNLSLWSRSGFSNRQKTFFFKFYNNILGLNVRTSHFVPNGTRNCFFCSKDPVPQQNDETFLHLFHTCATTKNWQTTFIGRCLPELPALVAQDQKSLWFLGYLPDQFSISVFFSIMTFQYCIWEAKLKKKIPSFNSMFIQFIDLIKQTAAFNPDLRDDISKNNYTLCRILLGGRQGDQDDE
jgi:hypothetical protein